MDQIKIENLQVYAHHGVLPEETALGQRFQISATLGLSTRKAGHSDALQDSVNYAAVCQEITSFLQAHTYALIEAAAEQLAQYLLLRFALLESITLEIQKPWAPIGLPVDTVAVCITRQWHTAYIGLGSNMGDKQRYLEDAVAFLEAQDAIQVQRVSDYRVTEPYGGVAQDDFLNGVACIRTLLTPHELLAVLQQGEANANRVREIHWGPRTLDLDLLFYDDIVLWDPDLVLPHPEIPKRSFVLEPMVQLAPYKIHPLLRKSMTELLARCQQGETP